MTSFRFMHAADLHLDSPFRGMTELPPSVRRRIRESTFAALDRLVDTAISEQVDFVVFSGDIYDLADRSLRAQIRFQQAMERMAEHGIKVFVAHGNHDPEQGRRATLAWPETVHFFGSNEVDTLPVYGRDGRLIAHVHGISFPTAVVVENLALKFAIRDSFVFNIAVLHSNVDGNADHDNYAPCNKHDLVRSGMDYWALGHIHKRNIVHESPLIVYPGNTQGRHMKETGAKGVYIAEVSERTASGSQHHVQLAFHPTDEIRFEERIVSTEGIVSEQEAIDVLERELQAVRAQSDGRSAFLRLIVEGSGPVHMKLSQSGLLHDIVDELREREAAKADDDAQPFVWIESCRIRTNASVQLEHVRERHAFLADLLDLSSDWAANPEQLEQVCRRVLAPLYDHPPARRQFPAWNAEHLAMLLEAAREIAASAVLREEGWEE